MRIAIAATGPDKDEEISRRGARAECYLVFDESGTLNEVVQNPFADYDRAVGIRVADYLAEKDVDVVAAANLGSGFTTALKDKGIRYAECDATVADVAKDLAGQFGAA